MLSKLLLAVSLAVAPVVSVSAQAGYSDFDTFQTADKYLQDFDYLIGNSYLLGLIMMTVFMSLITVLKIIYFMVFRFIIILKLHQ